MRALIFGCGYVGKRVATAWIEAGNEVFAITRSLSNANSFRMAGIQPLIGDVCEPASISELPVVDVVLHAIGFDRNSGRTQEEVTLGGMQNLLTATRGRCHRFIQISSTSVYGQSEGEWVDEDAECCPSQLGGTLNLAAERLLHDQFQNDPDFRFNILRLAGIYGPGRLLSRIESLRANVPLAGRGDSWLNLIHVDDAVTAIVACATKCEAGTTYNIVDDQPIERREYFNLLAKLVAAPTPVFDPSLARDRGSGGLNKRCSNLKACKNLGWSPMFASIATGLPQAIRESRV